MVKQNSPKMGRLLLLVMTLAKAVILAERAVLETVNIISFDYLEKQTTRNVRIAYKGIKNFLIS